MSVLEFHYLNTKEEKMKKQILASIIAGSILATGAFAMQRDRNHGDCQMGQKHERGMHYDKRRGHKMPLFGVLHKLNLTDAQQNKVRSIMDEQRKNRPKLSEAFTDKGFDKAKFESMQKQRRDDRIKNRADTIEKVYAVLSQKQKAQFKTLLELREDRGFMRGHRNW